jgi:hypothetical protein
VAEMGRPCCEWGSKAEMAWALARGQAQPFSDNFVTPNGSGGLFLGWDVFYRVAESVREIFFGLGCRLVI